MLSPLNYLQKAINIHPQDNCLRIKGIELTYNDFNESLNSVRHYFSEKGVRPNTKVAVYSDDDLFMLQSVFALWQLGATAIPMNIKYTHEKLRKIEDNIKPDIGFYYAPYNPGDEITFPVFEYLNGGPKEENSIMTEVRSSDVALIMFTSGSTGIPKGVPITHEAVYYNTFLTGERLKISKEDRIFLNTPPYTTSSLIHVLTMFSKGASVAIERGFMFGSDLLAQINHNNCSGFGGVPVHFSRILAALEKSEDTGKLKFLMNSGEHLPVPIIKKMKQKLPNVKIFCVYGLTEVAGRLCILDNEYVDEKIGSVGKPLNGMNITIRSEDGAELPNGNEGQVYVTGNLLTKGYVNNEAVNQKEFTKWGFATGDYGYKDLDGFLFLKGRKDDIIKVGGEKVSVKMIEEVLYNFDEFKEFVVNPVYDEKMGCVPSLQFVLKPGVIFDRPKLIRFLSKQLPSTHIPVKFEEVQNIERTTSGKTIRKKPTE